MNKSDIIQSVVDELTGKVKYVFSIYVKDPVAPKKTLWDKIRRKAPKDIELVRNFEIMPTTVGNQFRMGAKAMSLPTELFTEDGEVLQQAYQHLDALVYMIAVAIQNNRHEPSAELITFLTDNLDNTDIELILAASMLAANMQSFLNSIALAKGSVKILEPNASPLDGSESIASHTQA